MSENATTWLLGVIAAVAVIWGRRLHISPVVVLIALVFWTWVWGPVGALLAVPMTVTLLAAAVHVPALSPFAELLAAEEPSDDH